MVKIKHITLLLALLCSTVLKAQNYSVNDTVTEYPNWGTWYHDRFEGRKTANGEIFDQNKFTAAHWKIKLGTMVMVTNVNTGLQVIVKVNDRCPKRGVFDMSHRAANAIGIRGCQRVTIRVLPEGYEERWAAQETMFDSVRTRLNGKTAVAKTDAKSSSATSKPKKTTTQKTTSSTKSTVAKKTAATKKPATSSKSSTKSKEATTVPDRYNLILTSTTSRQEADTLIQLLPLFYQDKVNIKPLGNNRLQLNLEVGLDKGRAEELRRALLHSFPGCSITPAH